jgi:hypothetical protein
MGTPRFVVQDSQTPRAERQTKQIARLESLFRDTPLIELPVEIWYEISGYYLGLTRIATEEEKDIAWQKVKAYRQGRLLAKDLGSLGRCLFGFEPFDKINKRKWARETGYDASRWAKIKADPERLEKRRRQNAEAQRRRRVARRDLNVSNAESTVSYAEAAE